MRLILALAGLSEFSAPSQLTAATAAAEVCAPAGCLPGSSTSSSESSAGRCAKARGTTAPLEWTREPTLTPVLASDGSTYLTPGVHRLALNPTSHVNQTISRTSNSTTVLPPPEPLAFPRPLYSGEPGAGEWESLYLPPGWYASVGGHALWGAIPDRGALVAGKYDIEGFGNGEYNGPSVGTDNAPRFQKC